MGIANIVNTAGGGGGSSEIITHLVNSVDGAGLRLANQGYISCAHVSANKFGTNDFSVEFVLSQETNAVNADIFISNLNGSNQAVDAAVIRWDVVQNDNIQLVFTNSGAAETAYNFGYDPAPDLNEPTHYLVSADRSGNAVLYRNGAEIASISIAASGSANVGNSGQPTVIGSPVNNFGVKGNVYRLRTYSKALSSDEAKNVFDRADVPTALVSNLLLDLDCAYANPTQSTVIQDRGPNNQDGTLNGTITQTNVIKQLNSTSARIGTTAATPADGEVVADTVSVTGTGHDAAKITITNTASANARLLLNSGHGNWSVCNSDTVGDALEFRDESANATRLSIDSSGNLTLGTPAAGSAAAMFHISGAAPRIRLEDTSAPANYSQIAADNGQLTLAADGGQGQASSAIIAQVDGTTRLTIDSSGQVGVNNSAPSAPLEVSSSAASTSSVISTFSTTDSEHSVLALKKSSSATVGTKAVTADGEILGRIDAYGVDTNSNQRRGAQIEFNQAAAATGSKVAGNIVFKTSSTSANDVEAMRIDSTGLATFSAGITVNGAVGSFANGIYFSSQTGTAATGASTSTSVLNHYEEGTWTPVPKDNQATAVATSTALGRYVRVGKIVTCTYRLVRNDTQSLTNTLYLYGLPFPSQNNVQTKNIGGGTSWFPNDTYAGFNYALENTDQWIIRKNDATGYATTNVWSNGQELIGTIIYEADA